MAIAHAATDLKIPLWKYKNFNLFEFIKYHSSNNSKKRVLVSLALKGLIKF